MPRRRSPSLRGKYFHVYNRAVTGVLPFVSEVNAQRFIQTIQYYSYETDGISFSRFVKMSPGVRSNYAFSHYLHSKKIVSILEYCVLKNHYHIVLKQKEVHGVRKFMQKISSSFSHYYNIKSLRRGAVFESRYKSKRIFTKLQLKQVVRYVHINPLKHGYVENLDRALEYPFSSAQFYELKIPTYLDTKSVKRLFRSYSEYYHFLCYHKRKK